MEMRPGDEINKRLAVMAKLVGNMREGRQLKEAFVRDILKKGNQPKIMNLATITLQNQKMARSHS